MLCVIRILGKIQLLRKWKCSSQDVLSKVVNTPIPLPRRTTRSSSEHSWAGYPHPDLVTGLQKCLAAPVSVSEPQNIQPVVLGDAVGGSSPCESVLICCSLGGLSSWKLSPFGPEDETLVTCAGEALTVFLPLWEGMPRQVFSWIFIWFL